MALVCAVFCDISFAESPNDTLKQEITPVDSAKEARKLMYKASDGGIALPRLLSYTGKGLSVGLGLGYIYPLGGEKEALAAWKGAGEYYYARNFSAGLELLIYGGDVDSETMILYSRYRLHGRFHLNPTKWLDLFLAPLVWLEMTDIDDIRQEIRLDEENGDTLVVHNSSVYDDAPEQNGFAVGSEIGFGIHLPFNFGLFGESVYEYSFAGENVFSFSAGVGYDIRAVSPFLRRNVFATWVVLEFTWRRYVGEKWDNTGKFAFLGLQISL